MTERSLSWHENRTAPSAPNPISFVEWRRSHAATTPANATATLVPVDGQLIAILAGAAQEPVASVVVSPTELELFMDVFLGAAKGSSSNQRTIAEATKWLTSQRAGQKTAEGSGLIELNNVDPKLPDPPPIPK